MLQRRKQEGKRYNSYGKPLELLEKEKQIQAGTEARTAALSRREFKVVSQIQCVSFPN